MWPLDVDWKALRFGVEIEFVGGRMPVTVTAARFLVEAVRPRPVPL